MEPGPCDKIDAHKMKFPSRKRSKPNVHLTSLIDIVFLLLIFFLLSSNFVEQQGISILVPEVENESKDSLPNITVNIDEFGGLYFNDVRVNEALLHKLLQEHLAESKKQHVAIYADRKVEYDSVVRVIDIAKGAGAQDFLLITKTK